MLWYLSLKLTLMIASYQHFIYIQILFILNQNINSFVKWLEQCIFLTNFKLIFTLAYFNNKIIKE